MFGLGPTGLELLRLPEGGFFEYFCGLLGSNLLVSATTGIRVPSPEQDLFVSGNLYEERDHFFRELTKTIPDIVYVYDLDEGQLVYLNDRVTTILGYEAAELMLLGRGLLETYLHPDDQASAPRWFAKVNHLQKGEVLVHKFRVRHNNGEWRWMESREAVFKRDSSGRLVQVMAVANDVTDRENIELSLKEIQERNSSILKALPDLMFVQDAQGNFLDYYARDPEILFAPPGELMGRNIREVIPPDILGRLLVAFETALRTDEPQAVEYKAFVAGQERDYESRLVRCGADKILSVVRDITEQTRVAEALAASEARFATQYRGIPIPTYTLQRQGEDFVLIDLNDAALAHDEYKFGSPRGKTAADVFSGSPALLQLVRDCSDRGLAIETKFESDLFATDPEKRLKLNLVPVPPDLVMLFVEDITESEQNQQELDDKLKKLREANDELQRARELIFRNLQQLSLSHRKAAKESERYRQLFEFAPGGYITSSPEGMIREANQAACDLFATPPERLMGFPLSDFIASEDKQRFLGFLETLSLTNKIQEIEFSLSGQARQFYAAIKAVRVEFDGVTSLRWLIQDVSLRRLTEEALQKSEQFNRAIIESSNDSITILDLKGRILFVNEKAVDRMGAKPEFLFGRLWYQFWPKSVRAMAREQFKVAQKGGVGRFHGSSFAANGKIRWWDVAITPMTDQAGGVARMLVVSRDVTDQKDAEEKLQKKETFFRSLVENAHDFVTVMSYDAMILYESPASERILGFRAEEKLGKNCLDYLHPDDKERVTGELAELVQGKREIKTLEYRYLHKSGRYVPLEVIARVSTDENGEPVVIVNKRDITERQQKESQLRKLVARLLKVQDEEQRRLARELHDETAQNLVLLDINLATLERDLPDRTDEVQSAIAQSRTLISRSLREVRTISYLLHPPMLDEAGLQTALSWLIRGFSQRSDIQVDLDCPSRTDRFSPEVEIAVYRIVQEALTNIHRHSGSKTAQVKLERKGDSLILTIEDQGCGIPDTVLEKRTGVVESIGVGIPGMRERLSLLGGQLDVRSDASGTSLMAVLPLKAK